MAPESHTYLGMKKHSLSKTQLQDYLTLDVDSGRFKWRKTTGPAPQGSLAGTIGKQGYRRIGINGREYPAARLVWLWVHNDWPAHEVLHLNGDRLDDRPENLALNKHSRELPPLTPERLREILYYEETTGLFLPRKSRKGRKPKGLRIGWRKPGGYIMITIDGSAYRAHRLAWLYIHGEWPSMHLDHIDGDTSNNRISNLRLASVAENMANAKRPRTNTSGYKGVSWHRGAKKWTARMKANGTSHYLGLFATAEEAHAAYCEIAKRLKGAFGRTE